MAYRNPRFSYIHTLRDSGAGSLLPASDPFDAATPFTRWLDNQSRGLAGQADGNDIKAILERNAPLSSGFPALGRFFIPRGHNLGMDRMIQLQVDPGKGGTSPASPKLADTSVIDAWFPGSNAIDIEFLTGDPAASEYALSAIFTQYASLSTNAPRLGEFWWTNVAETQTGIASGWEAPVNPTVQRTEMRSGAVYTQEQGPERRAWTLRHEWLEPADKALYDDLVRRIGYRTLPFLWDHPDSGDAVVLVNAIDDSSQWTASDGVFNTITGGGPDGNDCLELVSLVTGQASMVLPGSAFLPEAGTDWRRKILQYDMLLPVDAAWVDQQSDLQFSLVSPAPKLGFSTYYTGSPFVNGTRVANIWIRVQVDLERDLNTTAINDPRGLVDLGAVDEISLKHTSLAPGQAVRYANLRLIDPEKQPRIVELADYRPTQVNESPTNGLGPRWTVELDLVEVTT